MFFSSRGEKQAEVTLPMRSPSLSTPKKSTIAASIPVFEIGLNALSAILDKAEAYAEAKRIDPTVLLTAGLFPDMFAFTRQVQSACDQAKNGGARLAGIDPPKYEDNEKTITELKAHRCIVLFLIPTAIGGDVCFTAISGRAASPLK